MQRAMRNLMFAVVAAAATAALPARAGSEWTLTKSANGTSATFTITRPDEITNFAQTVDFRLTPTGCRFELASDIPEFRFTRPSGDDAAFLCNGIAAVEIASGLDAFTNPGNPAGKRKPYPFRHEIYPAGRRRVLRSCLSSER